jgi:hypothetical protein
VLLRVLPGKVQLKRRCSGTGLIARLDAGRDSITKCLPRRSGTGLDFDALQKDASEMEILNCESSLT